MSMVALSIAEPQLRARVVAALGELGLGVAGNAAGGAALARLVRDSNAALVLADDAFLPEIKVAAPVPVLLLLREPLEDRALDALARGAAGVLANTVDGATLLAAIAALRAGLAVVPLAPLRRSSDAVDVAAPSTGGERTSPLLTPRELEVLAALADGASNKAIARRLGISFHTVKFHVAGILSKLGAETRTEAVAQGARLGLVML